MTWTVYGGGRYRRSWDRRYRAERTRQSHGKPVIKQSAAAGDIASTCQLVSLPPGSGWLSMTLVASDMALFASDTVVVKPAVASALIGVKSAVVTTFRPLHRIVLEACGDETAPELSADTIAVLENCPQTVGVEGDVNRRARPDREVPDLTLKGINNYTANAKTAD